MAASWAPGELEQVLRRAEIATGIDFTRYRVSTMQRRTELRMAMCDCVDAPAYLKRLEVDESEVAALVEALLIKTTWMYREPRTFGLLRRHALADLFALRAAERGSMIRAWVPACSTGEEAYTLAMCLDEARRTMPAFEFQVFATDVTDNALVVASEAVYPETAFTTLPDDLRTRYLVPFTSGDVRGARVADDLRERVVVARHDALRSARLAPQEAGVASFDIVCCRNLLVYLQPAAQEELFQRLLKTCSRGSLFVIGDSEALRAVTSQDQVTPIEGKIPVFRVR